MPQPEAGSVLLFDDDGDWEDVDAQALRRSRLLRSFENEGRAANRKAGACEHRLK
jgi:hypothetical protein